MFGESAPAGKIFLGTPDPSFFSIVGEAIVDLAGGAVAGGGDVDGDGIADFIIGAKNADIGVDANAGAAYVVFGANGLNSADLSTLNGADGFKILGETAGDFSANAVSIVGDVDGDGFDDILIGAEFSDADGNNSGAAYLVFGGDGLGATVDLADIAAGIGGIRLTGEGVANFAGSAVSGAGDANGDGFDDVLIGADGNDAAGIQAGAAYLLFGTDITGKVTQIGTDGDDTLTGSGAADVIVTGTGDDSLFGVGGADVLKGGAGDDLISIGDSNFRRIDGGAGDDTLSIFSTGFTLDLPAIGDETIRGIENVDLSGLGANTLTVAISDVAAMSDTGTLTVESLDGNDAITSPDTWEFLGSENIGGSTFQRFEALTNDTTLLVELGIDTAGLPSNQITTESVIDFAGGGFKITGESQYDSAGSSISSAGDVNGDGFDDFIIGAPFELVYGSGSGAAYVIFGTSSSVSAVNLDDVALGTGGFKIAGEELSDRAGYSVSSAGDVNGDGIADLLVGASLDDVGGSNAGAGYVIFGTTSSVSAVNLDDVALGTGGFKITGEAAGDFTGISISSAGDVNGDGIDDLVIGAQGDAAGGYGYNSGAAFVVFGTTSSVSAVNLDDVAGGTGGFKITGENNYDVAGRSVSSAGDVNGDGIDDLLVGARGNDAGGSQAGAAYVVFGTTSSVSAVNLDDVALGTGGFKIAGEAAFDLAGTSVSTAGDVNGDGLADIILGAPNDAAAGTEEGAAYVIFGTTSSVSAINLDDVALGTGGFKITGEAVDDLAGFSVSSAGDVNGDGLDDLLVGARLNDDSGSNAGAAYVVFGTTSSVSAVNLDDVALGTGGFKVTGEAADDRAGSSVSSAGDFNGDGFDDILVGASGNDEGGTAAGAGYILFGFDITGDVTVAGTEFPDVLIGTVGDDVIVSGQGDDLVIASTGADVVRAGSGDDDIDVNSNAFARIDGGSGDDALFLTGGFSLDLTALGDSVISGIEIIEFNNTGQTTLTVAASDVRAMSDTGKLTVQNNDLSTLSVADDTVQLADTWNFEGSDTGGAAAIHKFQVGQTFLDAEVSTLTNIGTVTVDSDATLSFTNATDIFTNTNLMEFSNDSTLTVETGTLLNAVGATISGGLFDAIDATLGTFQNDGTVNFGSSPGAFTVLGDLQNGHSASMLVELGGLEGGVSDGFDQLTVTGEFSAGGIIDVVEFGGFDVSAGDSFAVVQTGSITGSFDDITGLDVGGGVVLDATQSASGVTLTGRAVTHQGTAADDTLTGTSGDDVFVGGDGGDFVLGGGGADLMHGGAGDDVFVAADTGFGRIDGGGGVDTVRLDGAGQSFDLGGLRGDQLNAIETFDLTGTGDNTLTLDADMVFSATRGANELTGTENSLVIDGDAGDAVDAGAGWSNTGTVTIGGDGYSVYESADNGSQLFVNDDVTMTAA